MARFEVAGQRYADLSDARGGAALLNDCKYGHSVHDGVLSLTLPKKDVEVSGSRRLAIE